MNNPVRQQGQINSILMYHPATESGYTLFAVQVRNATLFAV